MKRKAITKKRFIASEPVHKYTSLGGKGPISVRVCAGMQATGGFDTNSTKFFPSLPNKLPALTTSSSSQTDNQESLQSM